MEKINTQSEKLLKHKLAAITGNKHTDVICNKTKQTVITVSLWPETVDRFSRCLDDVEAWLSSSRLRLSPDKTQVLWLGSKFQLLKVRDGVLEAVALASRRLEDNWSCPWPWPWPWSPSPWPWPWGPSPWPWPRTSCPWPWPRKTCSWSWSFSPYVPA